MAYHDHYDNCSSCGNHLSNCICSCEDCGETRENCQCYDPEFEPKWYDDDGSIEDYRDEIGMLEGRY